LSATLTFDPSNTVRRAFIKTRWTLETALWHVLVTESVTRSSIYWEMRKKIKDEFTDLPVSRQRKYLR